MTTVHTAVIPCYLGGTSLTTRTIGLGSIQFDLVAGSPIPLKGMTLRAEKTTDATKYVEGIVTAADEVSATIYATSSGGAGSVAAWTFTDGVLRFSSASYLPADAEGMYEPYIEQPATFGRGVSLDGAHTESDIGDMVVSNAGGRFDCIARYGFGRPASFYIGDTSDLAASLVRYLSPNVDDCIPDFEKVTFKLVGREAELDVLVQTARFGGTNSGSTGIDGLPDDIAGTVKPRTWGGPCENVTPVQLNGASRISGVNFTRAGATAPVNSMPAARDNEDLLTADGDQANLAALQADVIADGHWDSCLSAGLNRLGGTTFRGLTCDVTAGATSADRTVARVVEDVVGEIIDAGDISSADLTALDIASSASVGIYVSEEKTVVDVVDELVPAAGAKWGFDKDGIFRIVQITLPAGAPAYTFKRVSQTDTLAADEGDILEIIEGPFADDTSRRAYRRVNVLYRRNFTPRSTGDIAATTAAARAAFAQLEYRTVTAPVLAADEAAVLAKYPNAGELTVTTLLTSEADAQAEANRLFAMRNDRRDIIKIAVKFGADVAGAIDIGSVVAIDIPRFGYTGGKLFRVLYMSYDAANLVAVFTLWGGVAP